MLLVEIGSKRCVLWPWSRLETKKRNKENKKKIAGLVWLVWWAWLLDQAQKRNYKRDRDLEWPVKQQLDH